MSPDNTDLSIHQLYVTGQYRPAHPPALCHRTIQTCPSTSSMSPDNTDLPIHQLYVTGQYRPAHPPALCHRTLQTCPSTSSMSADNTDLSIHQFYVTGHYRPAHPPALMSPDNTDLSIHQLKTMVLFNHSSCAESLPPPPPHSLFPPPVWNVHDATLNNDPRTNMICEGWNNKFHNLVGTSPSINLASYRLVSKRRNNRQNCQTAGQRWAAVKARKAAIYSKAGTPEEPLCRQERRQKGSGADLARHRLEHTFKQEDGKLKVLWLLFCDFLACNFPSVTFFL